LVARLGEQGGRGGRVRPLDVAALGAVAAVGLGLARGGLDAEALASGGDRTLLLLLPALVSFAAAVAAARLLGPLARGAERGVRRHGSLALRLALLALSRAPARTASTAAFLLVALGLGLFAASWRATLERGARDEAAFDVPLDVTLTEGARLVLPFDAAGRSGYEALAPGVRAYPVLRRSADVAGVGASVVSTAVLGIPPAAVARLHWRSDFADVGTRELAHRLAAGGGSAGLRTVALPPGATSVRLPVRVRGVAVHVDLVVVGASGRTLLVPLGEPGPGDSRLRARLPHGARGVVGLALSLASAELYGFTHRDAEAEATAAATGTIELGALLAGSRQVTRWRGFVPRHGLRVLQAAPPRLAYSFAGGQTMLLRLPQPTDGRPLPAVVSPGVAQAASPDGLVTLDFQDTRVPARVAAVARRFPAADDGGEGFVVVDERRLATALDADAPGSGVPGEAWVSVPERSARALAARLARPPFSSLVVADRRAEQRRLASDPLARGIALALGAVALVALALGIVGFWIALGSELRDERGELFDLEAQGVAPATLRRQFRLRAAALAGLGLAGGALLGLALSRLVVAVVRVSAASTPPEPPLRLETAVGAGVLGALAFAAALFAVVEVATRRAFSAAAPERAPWSLE
ncbi:MAG TPA: FtsX-like permease family protein, partial [Gaiellaceae bacterium]|nr:FtsX-like permease family protein [Gaiellaceae bacterium]